MDLNLFENKEKGKNNFIEKFIEELKNTFINSSKDSKQGKLQETNNLSKNNISDEYNLYEKKKIFLDNKTRNGNNLAWVTDENSVCLSEHGDGGAYSISEIDLPKNAKVRRCI